MFKSCSQNVQIYQQFHCKCSKKIAHAQHLCKKRCEKPEKPKKPPTLSRQRPFSCFRFHVTSFHRHQPSAFLLPSAFLRLTSYFLLHPSALTLSIALDCFSKILCFASVALSFLARLSSRSFFLTAMAIGLSESMILSRYSL